MDSRCPRRSKANAACRGLASRSGHDDTCRHVDTNFAQHFTRIYTKNVRVAYFSISLSPTFVTFSSFPNGQCVFRPNTTNTYSSPNPLVYGSNPRPLFSFTLLHPAPPYTQQTREEAAEEEEPSQLRWENRVNRYGRAVFVLGLRGSHEEQKMRDAHAGCVSCGWASQPSCSRADTTVAYSTFGLGNAFYAGDNYAYYTYESW